MDNNEGCGCYDPDHDINNKNNVFIDTICPVCHKTYTNKQESGEVICSDCSKDIKHRVEILGIGGQRFSDTIYAVNRAVLGTDFQIIFITDLETIKTYGVCVTPAVIVDGKLMCEGRVPEYSEICRWIRQNKHLD